MFVRFVIVMIITMFNINIYAETNEERVDRVLRQNQMEADAILEELKDANAIFSSEEATRRWVNQGTNSLKSIFSNTPNAETVQRNLDNVLYPKKDSSNSTINYNERLRQRAEEYKQNN